MHFHSCDTNDGHTYWSVSHGKPVAVVEISEEATLLVPAGQLDRLIMRLHALWEARTAAGFEEGLHAGQTVSVAPALADLVAPAPGLPA